MKNAGRAPVRAVTAWDTRPRGETGFCAPPWGSIRIAVAEIEGLIGVDTPVAQIRPDASYAFTAGHIHIGEQDGGLVVGRCHDFPLRAADEAASPKLDAPGIAGRVRLEADAVAGQHRQAVGHGMGILDTGVNLFLISVGYITKGTAPIFSRPGLNSEDMVDPIPQALVLTAIVIGVAVLALALSLAIKLYQHHDTLNLRKIKDQRW